MVLVWVFVFHDNIVWDAGIHDTLVWDAGMGLGGAGLGDPYQAQLLAAQVRSSHPPSLSACSRLRAHTLTGL